MSRSAPPRPPTGRGAVTIRRCAATLALLAAAAGAGEAQPSPSDASPALDAATSQRVAERVVAQSARVKAGEVVLLVGGAGDARLLDDLWLAVRRAGADALVLTDTDERTRRSYALPAALDTLPPAAVVRVMDVADVVIQVNAADPAIARELAPERLAVRMRAMAPLYEKLRTWRGRYVEIGNGLYPTAGTAEIARVPLPRLRQLFRDALDVDFAELARVAEAVRARLATARTVRITAPDGSDVTLALRAEGVFASDGVITEDEARAGPPTARTWLPAGEVYARVAPGSARGVAVARDAWFGGARIDGLRATLADGRVLGYEARSGLAPLRAAYDAATAGRDAVTMLEVGVNPRVVAPAGSALRVLSGAGQVSLQVGNDAWAGGENSSSFGQLFAWTDATLTVDGEVLVERGRLRVPGASPAAAAPRR